MEVQKNVISWIRFIIKSSICLDSYIIVSLVGVYFFNKGIQQSQKEAQAEIGQTNIIFSIILIAMCIAGFWWYYLK